MKTNHLIFCLLAIFALSSCEETITLKEPKKIEHFNGYVQKGPFINGTSVTISELDEELNQTGRSYQTTVADNKGSFEQNQMELISGYVQLKADGYYFNEVTGELSASPLTLYALVDVSDVNSANINVLTHLEKPRAEHLVKNENISLSEAKAQAQREILQIFNMTPDTISGSETLNIVQTGVNNAMLLAISAILQGPGSTADLSQLLADIITDIKTDGILNDATLGSKLFDNARLTNMDEVKSNLENQYKKLGMTDVVIPDFKQYVSYFIENTEFIAEKLITYPMAGTYGSNLLCDTFNIFTPGTIHSLKADLPEGTALKIILKGKPNNWAYAVIPAPENWNVKTYDMATQSQEFTVKNSGQSNDLYIHIGQDADSIQIEYYENGAIAPTKTKTIYSTKKAEEPNNEFIIYPEMGLIVNYYNVLHDSISYTREGKVYSIFALVPLKKNVKVIFKSDSKVWVENPNNAGLHNWAQKDFDSSTNSQEFYTTGTGKCEMSVTFPVSQKMTIEFYENNATEPTKIKYLNY